MILPTNRWQQVQKHEFFTEDEELAIFKKTGVRGAHTSAAVFRSCSMAYRRRCFRRVRISFAQWSPSKPKPVPQP